jgi:death-on-curing protein
VDEPKWLKFDAILKMHQRQLAEHGGLPGVRDQGRLEAAMAGPRQFFVYGEPPPDLAALATAYAGGFVRNPPFVDGNKRIAHLAARTFLIINGWNVNASAEEKYVFAYRLASREITEDEFASWIRSHLEPSSRRTGRST